MEDSGINDIHNLYQIVAQWDLNKIEKNELKILKLLAEGGQGKVKLAEYLDMQIIVKFLHDFKVKDYTSEIQNVYQFRHPNIPKFIGVYTDSNHFGVVFECVQGQTLSTLIQKERKGEKIRLIEKIVYLIQLAAVIEFLHDHKLIHRDLKTANIIIDLLGNLKLIDYGIAITEEKASKLKTADISMTPQYMAPEVQDSGTDDGGEEGIYNITNRIDTWTYGLIMSELVTLCRPWCSKPKDKNKSDIEIWTYLNKKKPYIFPRINENPQFDTVITALIKDCTNYDPQLRPSMKCIKLKLIQLFRDQLIDEIKLREIMKHTPSKQGTNPIGKAQSFMCLNSYTNEKAQKPKLKKKMGLGRKQTQKISAYFQRTESDLKSSKSVIIKFKPKTSEDEITPADNKESFEDNALIKPMRMYLEKIEKEKEIKKNKLSLKKSELLGIETKINEERKKLISINLKEYIFMTYDYANNSLIVFNFNKKKTSTHVSILNDLLNPNKENINLILSHSLQVDNQLYIIGGIYVDNRNSNNESNFSKKCFLYDHTSDKIEKLKDMWLERNKCSALVFQGQIYVFGGKNNLKFEFFDKRYNFWILSQEEMVKGVDNPILVNVNNSSIMIFENIHDHNTNTINYSKVLSFQVYDSKVKKYSLFGLNISDILPESLISIETGFLNSMEENEIVLLGNLVKEKDTKNTNYPYVLKLRGNLDNFENLQLSEAFDFTFRECKNFINKSKRSNSLKSETTFSIFGTKSLFDYGDKFYYFYSDGQNLKLNYINKELAPKSETA